MTTAFVDREVSYMLLGKRSCDQVNKTLIENTKMSKDHNLEFVFSVDNYTMRFHAGDFLKPYFVEEV